MSGEDASNEQAGPPRLSRTVIALGLVSLFTDISSEMAYTQVPLFLESVLHANAAQIGLIEGSAESIASLLKLVSGWFSDRSGRRKPLTIAGYSLGAISKPLMALATAWQGIWFLRFLDRVGKGLRTSPRDALIAENTPKALRGRAFGLHRAMDTTGAVLGPLLGYWFLTHVSTDLRRLFLFAGIPGLLAVLTLLFLVKEPKPLAPGPNPTPREREEALTPASSPAPPGSGDALTSGPDPTPRERDGRSAAKRPPLPRYRDLQPAYRRFLAVVLLFNLGNSSDAFLILRAKGIGFTATGILGLYAAFNLVEAILGYGAGKLSDRVGRRPLIIAGYLIFGAVYLGFALASSRIEIAALFLLYGGYYTLTQGVQRAFAADLADPEQRATQIGAYHTVVGLALLPASALAGVLFDWKPAAPFLVGAVTAGLSALLLATVPAGKSALS